MTKQLQLGDRVEFIQEVDNPFVDVSVGDRGTVTSIGQHDDNVVGILLDNESHREELEEWGGELHLLNNPETDWDKLATGEHFLQGLDFIKVIRS